MTKVKKVNIQNSDSVEKKNKKKLNKRQRQTQIKKKLKASRKIISDNSKESPQNKIKNFNVDAKPNPLSTLHLKTLNTAKKKTVQKSRKANKILKPVIDVKNPENYSSNWKQLKNIISDSASKRDSKPSYKRKWENQISQKPVAAVNNTETNNNDDNDKIWFDDVDPILVEDSSYNLQETEHEQLLFDNQSQTNTSSNNLKKENSYPGLTKIIALDCEMVGGGDNGEEDLLARISIVNHFGNCLYDKYVKPREPVKDYRTEFSGIRPEDLVNGEPFEVVQKEVSDLIKGRTVVGHALNNDFAVLFLTHPKKLIRDTSRYKPFVKLIGGGTPGLKKLTEKILGVKIQGGEHDSIQDSQAAMRLYTLHRKEWEEGIRLKNSKNKSKTSKEKKINDSK